MEDWFKVKEIDQIDSPSLIIYRDRAKENIQVLKGMIDDPSRLRPHVKTNKTIEATLLMLEAGIQKFKCATIAEAEMLAEAGSKDVLLAYQPVGPKISRFISLIKKYPGTDFSCLIDNYTSAQTISKTAHAAKIIIPVFIDLNVGMNRTGISPGTQTIDLFLKTIDLPGIHVIGLHAYDGHIRNADLKEREEACEMAFAPVIKVQKELEKKGFEKLTIVAGGTPTFPIHAKRKDVECSPGTFIYWDKNYQEGLPEQNFHLAALVITRVVSLPDSTKICLDLGHKSIASENEITKRVYFLNAPDLKPIGHSEEHLIVETNAGHKYKVGDVLYGIPHHICPTCALYERAIVVQDGKIAGEWKIVGRDRKISI